MKKYLKHQFRNLMTFEMKKWSSQWTQFMQLRKEAWKEKFMTSTGLNPWPRDTGAMLYQLSYEATDVRSRCCHGRQWFHSSVGRASHRYHEVTGSNPVEVLNFFQASLCNCINCVTATIISSFHFISAVHIWFILYIINTYDFSYKNPFSLHVVMPENLLNLLPKVDLKSTWLQVRFGPWWELAYGLRHTWPIGNGSHLKVMCTCSENHVNAKRH